MLAVDLDQALAKFPQLGKGNGGAVDKTTGAAICPDHAAQQALVAVIQLVLLQPFAGGWGICQ
ncbi:hypothetical protein D3C76_1383310 [compost metagenome]